MRNYLNITGFAFFVALLGTVSTGVTPDRYGDSGSRDAQSDLPFKKMLDDPVTFSGPHDPKTKLEDIESIRIGFFSPNDASRWAGLAIWNGALLAVEQANATGGYKGCSFELVQRWADDPWAGGSAQLIRLIYDDEIWALIGALDGQASHLAEQIATKAWVPMIAPVSSDPTLTHIRIPWIFRIPPDDASQAQCLLQSVQAETSGAIGCLVSAVHHDARVFAEELVSAARNFSDLRIRYHLSLGNLAQDFRDVAARIATFQPDFLIISGQGKQVTDFLNVLETKEIQIPVFLPWIPDLDAPSHQTKYRAPVFRTLPFDQASVPCDSFFRSFRVRFASAPGYLEAYGFDAANLIIEAIETSGLDRPGIRNAIAHQSGIGVSGSIMWDNGGGNLARPLVVPWLGANPR